MKKEMKDGPCLSELLRYTVQHIGAGDIETQGGYRVWDGPDLRSHIELRSGEYFRMKGISYSHIDRVYVANRSIVGTRI